MQILKFSRIVFRVASASILLSGLFAWVPRIIALAGDCDGSAGVVNDTVNCTADPTVPDDDVGLDLGDDIYFQDDDVVAFTVSGDALDDGSENVGNGGDDQITIGGGVGGAFFISGDGTDGEGGDDTITLDGGSFLLFGDDVTGNGGNDTIVINGLVVVLVAGDGADGDGGDDTIIINGEVSMVEGDEVGGNGGDDVIIINGYVDLDVTGDCASFDGGDDTIVVNGEVGGDVIGDCVGGSGGNDSVTLGNNSYVGGIIDGEDGIDILQFGFLTQDQLVGYDPAGGSLIFNGNLYTWANFEQLIGLLQQLGYRVLFSRNGIAAIAVEDGIKVINENGVVAFIPFSSTSSIGSLGMTFQSVAHSMGWFVKVFNLGTNPSNPSNDLFQVYIYNALGVLQGQFTFSE